MTTKQLKKSSPRFTAAVILFIFPYQRARDLTSGLLQ